jgi:two-component system, OmpR family, sensor kinase
MTAAMTVTMTMTVEFTTMTTMVGGTTMLTMTERRFRVGFRARVLGAFVALVAGATLGGLMIQRAVLLQRHERDVDATLEQEVAELEKLAGGTNPTTGQPFGRDAAAIFETFMDRNVPADGEVFLAFAGGLIKRSAASPVSLEQDRALVERWLALTESEWGNLSTDAGPVRYVAVPLRVDGQTQGLFVVANFLQGERDEIDSSTRVAAVVAIGVLLLATAAAWFVAGRLLRPVRRLTAAAESISDTELDRRIPVEGSDEIARLAHRFNEMLDRLASSFATQREFIDDAGHELATPITIVRGHLELMGDDPEDRRETVALVTQELDRMARIVDDLLLLAKAEQPDFLQPDTIELADFTADLMAKARALGDRQWTLDASATGTIHADRQRLTQAMLNLARNAVDHTPADATVAIGSAWAGNTVRLWIRDTGPGIDPSEHERLFERFARGRTGRHRSRGAGLGLAIVRSIAEAHGGHVELASRPGAGATFTISLPALPPPGPAARTTDHPEDLIMWQELQS